MEIKRMKCTIEALVLSGELRVASDTDKNMFDRIKNIEISFEDHMKIKDYIKFIGVNNEFCKIINLFKVPDGEIPAGFKPEFVYGKDSSIRINLKRDISYAANGVKRPTNVLFSANSANPYEVATMKDHIASLTTNPQLIYERFINNPKANIDNQFKDRYEVLEELCKIVGPGVDISVEVNNPFADENVIFEEIARFEEILTPYRLVAKIPHTGPLNSNNVKDFIDDNYNIAYDKGNAADCFRGHNLAYKLSEKGYRVNFTLMFEPYQTALALQAKPYFINTFVEKRYSNSLGIKTLLEKIDETGDNSYRDELRDFMISEDIIAPKDANSTYAEEKARNLLAFRSLDTSEGYDGLDSVRHSLRVLRQSNLPETRLILCNMKSAKTYMDIDKLLMQPEFADMSQRVIITCEPEYFAQFTSSPFVYTYQRAFLNSVKGMLMV